VIGLGLISRYQWYSTTMIGPSIFDVQCSSFNAFFLPTRHEDSVNPRQPVIGMDLLSDSRVENTRGVS